LLLQVCRTFATTGTCPYGTRCRFIHQSAALAQLRIATGNTPRASNSNSSPFANGGSIPGSPATDNMLLPALANIIQQAQAQQAQQQAQQQYSPNSSNGNLRSLSPASFGQQQQQNGNGMHSSSSFGSLLGMNNNGGLNHGLSGSSPALGAIGDAMFHPGTNGNKLSVAVANYQQQQQQNQHLSAPCTPHGDALTLQGLMRRSTSDNALPVTPTAGANGSGVGTATGTPTSARRLPIFSALVQGDDLI
jgi:Zinc finger C-x8-C-x5-C-x3-H type (and similar)